MSHCEILQQDIQSLLEYFSKVLYKAKDCENGSMGHDVMQKCAVLMKLDYSVIEISNATGELSSYYPSQILIPECESVRNGHSNSSSTNNISSDSNGVNDSKIPKTPYTIYETANDATRLRDLINKAKLARCRGRFPLPVILYRGKYICRSATLSGGPEIYGRSGLNYIWTYGVDSAATSTAQQQNNITKKDECIDEVDAYEAQEASLTNELTQLSTTPVQSQPTTDKNSGEWQLFDRVRSSDIKLLKTLNIGTIVDFMVEKKKVKFGMNVTSSEKVDKEKRYSDFTIISLPYPGCEFFKEFRNNDYSAKGLIFDWAQAYVDASIDVPNDILTNQLNIDWDNYKGWDLIKITQNYLKLLLKQVQENSSGLLIHCISGWDRTPLFVSLLRLSLWADGVIHQNLNHMQILYFTIAYDWFLFGHNLPDRLCKGEEIFFFCFYVLKYIIDEEYSIVTQRSKSKHSSGSGSIAVLQADSECAFDGILLEGGCGGSSISLNSTCSCASGKYSQQETNVSANILPDESINGNVFSHSQDSNSSVGCVSNDSNLGNHNNHTWSPQPKRTSPVSVPAVPTNLLRQRQESSSSLSVGSWQMISTTGSLRSSDSATALQTQNDGQTSSTSGSSNNSYGLNHGSNNHLCSSVIATSNNGFNNSTTPNANQILPQQQQQDSIETILDDEIFTSIYNHDVCIQRQERLCALRALFYNCYSSTIGFNCRGTQDSSSFGTLLGNIAEKVGLTQRTTV